MSLQRKKKSRTSVKKICFSTLSKSTPRVGVLGVCKGKCISSSIWTSHWVNHDAYDILDFFYLKKLNDLQYIIGQMQLYEFDTDITYSKSDPFFYSIHCYHFKKKSITSGMQQISFLLHAITGHFLFTLQKGDSLRNRLRKWK